MFDVWNYIERVESVNENEIVMMESEEAKVKYTQGKC